MAVVSLVAAFLTATSTPVADDLHSRGVNIHIGDLSAIAGYVAPTDGSSPVETERERVRGHLLFAADLLAAKDTSAWPAEQREARARNLDRLRAYAIAGEFPHNDDHADALRPTFVDARGTLCAVGALFAADHGRGAAERIAATQKYAFVPQIRDPQMAAWQETSGLSLTDLAIIQPTYNHMPRDPSEPGPPDRRMWLPFGLLDRIQLAPPRISATTELGSEDSWNTARTTLHAQASTTCDCRMGAYGTLPVNYAIVPASVDVAAAGGPIKSDTSRAWFGTADVGVFIGDEGSHEQSVYRIGALLPTASDDPHRTFTGARVGDLALELPQSAGMRLSGSKLWGWVELPSGWLGRGTHLAARTDFGVDIAREWENERLMHVIPRAGVGMLFARRHGSLSFDAALAVDPTDHGDLRTRFSAGVTGRLARSDGQGSMFQPGLTIATVRTPEGWGATLAIDIALSGKTKRRYYDYD